MLFPPSPLTFPVPTSTHFMSILQALRNAWEAMHLFQTELQLEAVLSILLWISVFFNWRTATYAMHQEASIDIKWQIPFSEACPVSIFAQYIDKMTITEYITLKRENTQRETSFPKWRWGRRKMAASANASLQLLSTYLTQVRETFFLSNKKIAYLSQSCMSFTF